MKVRDVDDLHDEHLLIADVRELLAKLGRGDESLGHARAALSGDRVDHHAVAQVPASSAEHHAEELPVHALRLVQRGIDVPGDVRALRLKRDAAAVAVASKPSDVGSVAVDADEVVVRGWAAVGGDLSAGPGGGGGAECADRGRGGAPRLSVSQRANRGAEPRAARDPVRTRRRDG